jgi:hypothetical protein
MNKNGFAMNGRYKRKQDIRQSAVQDNIMLLYKAVSIAKEFIEI